MMTEKTRGTAVFHQEARNVPKMAITTCILMLDLIVIAMLKMILITMSHTILITMLPARQECYYPGTNHAMITAVTAVQ